MSSNLSDSVHMHQTYFELPPSAYHDPREVLIKHIIAQLYIQIKESVAGIGDVHALLGLKLRFVKLFNSQHDIHHLMAGSNQIAGELLNMLKDNAPDKLYLAVHRGIEDTNAQIAQLLSMLSSLKHVERSNSFVLDGKIYLANKSLETFISNPGYIASCLELIGEYKCYIVKMAEESWLQGFSMTEQEVESVKILSKQCDSVVDIIVRSIIQTEYPDQCKTLVAYEARPSYAFKVNRQRKKMAIREGYFLLGRLMGIIAHANNHQQTQAPSIHQVDPVALFLQASGIHVDAEQSNIIRQLMQLRISHGLSPGEFTARIASSVRTAFKHALIAGIIVRKGVMHGGAIENCMMQQGLYLSSDNPEQYVDDWIKSGDLQGFGHRIHKVSNVSHDALQGSDPRVAIMLKAIKQGFPDKFTVIEQLERFAIQVQRTKSTLSPNTDFLSGMLFHCLGISPKEGSGLFLAARLPGLIAEIINQLDYKSNALRPPLPVTLPYF